MGYARHVGRVGALAITLGVGIALGSSPGVAYAEPSSSSSTSGSSSKSASSSSTDTASRKKGSKGGADGSDSSESADDSTADNEPADGEDSDDAAPRAGDEPKRDRDSTKRSVRRGWADRHPATRSVTGPPDSGQATETPPKVVTFAAADATVTLPAAASVASAPTPKTPKKSPTLVSVVSDVVSSLLHPAAAPVPESPPIQAPVMVAALAAVRDELERNTLRRNATAAAPQTVTALADDTPNVLLIGVDGTNLSRILDNTDNSNFFSLMQTGTTAAASIVGHTTISNPSWSAILTGAWGEKTGVINNVFTPWTYNKWPTVFNQLEAFDAGIETTTIADWDVISAIAGAGSTGADNITNIAQIAGDTNWLLTDDAVGDATEAAIAGADLAVPNFIFSYFVGVDENGHMYGGASQQYADAITNVDRNLAEILEAVNNSGEQWTIIVVTDHGHQPQKGLGHGFQSPPETSTFVIANNPSIFAEGAINLQYQIVDVTPTVMTLFGGPPPLNADGVSLTDLDGSNVTPVNNNEALRGALQDAIAMYGYPDIGTQLVLGLRTIVTTVPYYVFGLTNQLTGALQGIADQDIFLISPLAKIAIVPVQFVGDIAYVATNFAAQITAGLTGVTGASIFPLWPPAPPSFPSTPEEATTPDAYLLVCGDARGSSAVSWCGEQPIAV